MFDFDFYAASLSDHLVKEREGFWASTRRNPVSYPHTAHEAYALIEDESFWFYHRSACIISLVSRFTPEGPLLDVGGGNGAVSLALQNAGFCTVVLEPGRSGAEAARARGLPVICADFLSAELADDTVAAIGLFDVIEHVADSLKLLVSARRALRPGGWLYITAPAYKGLWSAEDNLAGHYRRYTLNSMRRELRKAGLKIVFSSYIFSPLILPVLLLRSMPSLFGRTRGLRRQVVVDHKIPRNALGEAIHRILAAERRRIAEGKAVPLGTSVVLVARKDA